MVNSLGDALVGITDVARGVPTGSIARKSRESGKSAGGPDVSCRKMTRDDRADPELPVFRDYGHSLPIAVTDKVCADPKTTNAALFRARHSLFESEDRSTWRPASWSSWIPPVPKTAGRQPFPAVPAVEFVPIQGLQGRHTGLVQCILPPARGQPLNSDL